MDKMIENEIISHKNVVIEIFNQMMPQIKESCTIVVETLAAGNKIILMGNGGSAADAQHIAAEFTGRFKVEKKGLPAVAITTDTSALTAIGNDYGFEQIFERQVEAIAKEGDLLVGISSTGNSENVLRAFEKGKELGCRSIGLSGKGGGKFVDKCDLNLIVPSNDTPRIQEMHILIGHIICQAVDDQYK